MAAHRWQCVILPLQVHKARIITRAVRSMWVNDATFLGKLRVRLSTLQPWVRRAAALLQGGLLSACGALDGQQMLLADLPALGGDRAQAAGACGC